MYKEITQREAKEMIDTKGVTILDVRTPEEFFAGHIKDAVLLPDFDINEKATTILKDKNATILVYCRSGKRSKIAAAVLWDLGYRNIFEFGGIIDWEYGVEK